MSDFTFHMNDAGPKTSTLDGCLLSTEIMRAWTKRGYIADPTFVGTPEQFSGNADYRLTLGVSPYEQFYRQGAFQRPETTPEAP